MKWLRITIGSSHIKQLATVYVEQNLAILLISGVLERLNVVMWKLAGKCTLNP
jgi:hypothetical protein